MSFLFNAGLVPATLGLPKWFSHIPEDRKIAFDHRNRVLAFRTVEEKESFLKTGIRRGESISLGREIEDYTHGSLGLVLGYPPLAVDSFVAGDADCVIRYFDSMCVARYADLDENLHFLRNAYGSIAEDAVITVYESVPKGLPKEQRHQFFSSRRKDEYSFTL